MLVHQAGSVQVGEVVRYTLTYTPAADKIVPTPEKLHVTVKNTSASPLRAAYLHGPYTLYAACYPISFNPHAKHDRHGDDGLPQFEPYLKAGGSWNAAIVIPPCIRLTPEASTQFNGGSVTWVIEIISQVIFSASAAVHFELTVSRDEKPTDLLPRKLSPSGLPPPAQLHDHWSLESRGYQVSAAKGVYSGSISLLVDDTASLWNTPPFPPSDGKCVAGEGSMQTSPGQISTAGLQESPRAIMSRTDPPRRKSIHLVLLTHGLHSNLGADMLFLKESIDEAARSARKEAMKDQREMKTRVYEYNAENDNKDDDYEQVIVRGFPGNAARTERGIQYLGKRLAKYVLLMTYPDQPYLPPRNLKAGGPSGPIAGWKNVDRESTDAEELDLHHSYKITSISFIGHSLGGLVQTYAIAYIRKYSPQFFELIKPVNFIALATPFLGLSNENPVYVRFALDLGLVGRTGQDLGLSWTAPRVKGGLGGIVAGKSDDSGKSPEPGSKPLLRILPSGVAHEVLLKFQRRTIYSNVVNDGIVPLRTSSLLFLDWKGLERVEKASRGNGLVGTMAEWGWAELTGASSKSLRTTCLAPETPLNNGSEEDAEGKAGYKHTRTKAAVDAASEPDLSQFLSRPDGENLNRTEPGLETTSPQPTSPGALSSLLSIFKLKESKVPSGNKQMRVYRQSQTLTSLNDPLGEPSSTKLRRTSTFNSHEEAGVNTPPRTTFFESAGDILMPPLPPIEFILDPAVRPRTIFHDRIYYPDDIPPPKPAKRRTDGSSSSTVDGLGIGLSSMNGPKEISEDGLKVEEKIARAYHRGLSWRKVLVRLEPDAHNNIIVRRMLTNAYGWPVVKHLVDTHFGYSSSEQTGKNVKVPDEGGSSLGTGTTTAIEDKMVPEVPEAASCQKALSEA